MSYRVAHVRFTKTGRTYAVNCHRRDLSSGDIVVVEMSNSRKCSTTKSSLRLTACAKLATALQDRAKSGNEVPRAGNPADGLLAGR
jgi:hypothetical protein